MAGPLVGSVQNSCTRYLQFVEQRQNREYSVSVYKLVLSVFLESSLSSLLDRAHKGFVVQPQKGLHLVANVIPL